MIHEIVSLIKENPLGSFIVILAVLWACERVITAFINRNKPPATVCECPCCDEDDECEEDEVVARGGQVEEED